MRKAILCTIPVAVTAFLAALKLSGAITLSWWWVTAPIWAPAAAATLGVTVIICVIGWWHAKHYDSGVY